MTSDRDLRALFDAWLRDRGAVHRLTQAFGAMLRAHGEELTTGVVRAAYPPQVAAITHTAGSGVRCSRCGVPTGSCMSDLCPQDGRPPAPAITHTDGSPLRTFGGSMHERTEARLAAIDAERFARAEAMFSGGVKP